MKLRDLKLRDLVRGLLRRYYTVRGFYPIDIRGEKFRVDPRDFYHWTRVSLGEREPHTFKILCENLKSDAVYLDIGAWIGPMVLYASRICSEVYCLEPDPVAYERLLVNLRLNNTDNVIALRKALYSKDGYIKLGPKNRFGDSMTSILLQDKDDALEVEGICISTLVETQNLKRVDFLKIDIEGGEYDVLPSMNEFLREKRPKLYLSLHPLNIPKRDVVKKTKDIIEILRTYNHCYDGNLRRLELEELLEERNLSRFFEVLLTD